MGVEIFLSSMSNATEYQGEYQGIVEIWLLDGANDNILATIDKICIRKDEEPTPFFVMGDIPAQVVKKEGCCGSIVFNKPLPVIKTPPSSLKVLIMRQPPTGDAYNIILDKIEFIKEGCRISLEEAYGFDIAVFVAKMCQGLS